MAGPFIYNRVRETSTIEGTGTVTLAGAVAGYRTFASVFDDEDLVFYVIEAINSSGQPTGDWEAGRGTYQATGQLERTTVLGSSNSGSAVNFAAGTKYVYTAIVANDTTGRLYVPQSFEQAYASRPTVGNEADLAFMSDGFAVERDDGSAWSPYGPLYKFTPPVPGDFSWVNQDTATVDTTYGGIYLENATSNGSAVGLNMRVKSKTGTWTLTAGFLTNHPIGVIGDCGILARESGTGKVCCTRVRNDTSGGSFDIIRYSSPTAQAGTVLSVVACAHLWSGGVIWNRIQNNGTNLIFSVSTDGQHFHTVGTVALTTAFTTNSDQLGFHVEPFSSGAGMTLLSWKEGA